jgi:4-hydroxy-4-methyl-2-oxoglutarate aldolase
MAEATQAVGKLVEELAGIDSPTVANAVDSFHVRDATEGFAGSDLRCAYPDLPPMVGYAVTCTDDSSTPRSDPGRGYEQLYEAIAASPKPVIVVFKCLGDPKRSLHMGDVMASIVSRLGAVGTVTDGGVRDILAVRERVPGFQMFATGFVVAGGAPSLGDVGINVSICGLTIRPGELLHGDANGLLTIPSSIAAEVASAARRIQVSEGERVDFVRSNEFAIDRLTSGH